MARPVPADLEDALADHPTARERFWAMPSEQKDAWVAAGMACDVADVGAGALAGLRGTLPPASAAMVTGTAAFFAVASAWLLQS